LFALSDVLKKYIKTFSNSNLRVLNKIKEMFLIKKTKDVLSFALKKT
jgi:hypothetical protein